jgi:hypothetical protein
MTTWRQSHHNILKVKRLLRGIQRLKRSTSKDEARSLSRKLSHFFINFLALYFPQKTCFMAVFIFGIGRHFHPARAFADPEDI